jgi:hypothetical protein
MDFMVKINGTNRPLDVVRSNARRAEGIRRSAELMSGEMKVIAKDGKAVYRGFAG